MRTTDLPRDKVQHLIRVVQELSLSRDLNGIMRIVRKNARKLVDADGVTFVLRDGEMCYYADEEAISPLWKGCRFPMSACISGWSMMKRKTAIIEDIFQDPRIPVDVYQPTFVKSLVMTPIRVKDPIGAIGIYWAEEHKATEEEVELIRSLADVTAVVMENVSLYNDLEKRVEERTARLEAFSYSVAHDLKNPLAGMEMRLRSLREVLENGDHKEKEEIADDLEEGIERMKELISGLLKFSLLGEEGMKKEWTDMTEMVKRIAELSKKRHKEREVEIHIGELAKEQVDPTLFQRAWANLISNAIKYSKEGERCVVEIDMEERKGERVYSIRDNGIGFRQERANDLFKAFLRIDPEEKVEGSGIGLSLVQQIVLKHGGEIWAEGVQGKGACFYFSLPWNRSERKMIENVN